MSNGENQEWQYRLWQRIFKDHKGEQVPYDRNSIDQAIRLIDVRQHEIIRERYQYRDTQVGTGIGMGISSSMVGKLERRAIAEIRRELRRLHK